MCVKVIMCNISVVFLRCSVVLIVVAVVVVVAAAAAVY